MGRAGEVIEFCECCMQRRYIIMLYINYCHVQDHQWTLIRPDNYLAALDGVRLKPEQIAAKLREIEVKISQGKDVMAAYREAGATDKSYYRWRREYGGMKVDQAKRWHRWWRHVMHAVR